MSQPCYKFYSAAFDEVTYLTQEQFDRLQRRYEWVKAELPRRLREEGYNVTVIGDGSPHS